MAESDSAKRAGKAPISTHPAFPAIVALWFAGLLGLGSLVLPIALFERLSAVSGIVALIPAAEPPLGFTARAAIALAGALVGGATGLLLARQIARLHAPVPKPRSLERSEAREWRPLSARDELGEEGLGWAGIALPEDDADTPAEREAEPAEAHFPMQDQTMIEGQSVAPRAEDRSDEPGFADVQAEFVEAPAPQLSIVERGAAHAEVPPSIYDRPLDDLGLVQLAGRLGAAIERRRTLKAAQAAAAPAALTPDMPAAVEVAEAEDAARAMADFFGPAPQAFRSPDRSDAVPLHPSAPLSMRPLNVDDEDEDEDDAFAGSFSLPLAGLANGHGLSAGEPAEEDEDPYEGDADEGEYSSLLAMKNPFSRHEEFVRVDGSEPDDGDFEPVVSFPPAGWTAERETPAGSRFAQPAAEAEWAAGAHENSTDSAAPAAAQGAPRDPAETERHLREALAALQRMNGAA